MNPLFYPYTGNGIENNEAHLFLHIFDQIAGEMEARSHLRRTTAEDKGKPGLQVTCITNVGSYGEFQATVKRELGDPIKLWGYSYSFGTPGFDPEERANEIRAHFINKYSTAPTKLVEGQDFKIEGARLSFMRRKRYADFMDDIQFNGLRLSPMRTPLAGGGVIVADAGDVGGSVVSLDVFRRRTVSAQTAATGNAVVPFFK